MSSATDVAPPPPSSRTTAPTALSEEGRLGEATGATRRQENWLLLGAALGYVVLYLLFWPPVNAIMDESVYLNAAYAMRHGTLYLDVAGIDSLFSYPVHGHYIVQYPPGMPALLAAVSLFGWQATAATNLFIHLGVFWILTRVLRELRVAVVWSLLYLLHPTAVVYSRTVMSDPASTLLVTLAFLYFVRKRYLWTGLLVGVAVLVRTANGAALPLFLLGLLPAFTPGNDNDGGAPEGELRTRIRSAVLLCAGAAPFVVAAYLYQAIVQEGGWKKYSSGGQFGLHNLPHVLPHYLLQMALLYPGLIVVPLLFRGRGRMALLCLTYGFVLFYGCYHFTDATGSFAETLIVGQRYMLTVMPLFVVAYGQALDRLVLQRLSPAVRRGAVAALFVCLGLAAVAVNAKHQKYLADSRRLRDALVRTITPGDALFCNPHVAKLLNPGLNGGIRFYILDPNQPPAPALNKIAAAVNAGRQRVIVTDWSRDYRVETGSEQDVLSRIKERFDCRPIQLAAGADSLPPGVALMDVVGIRPESAVKAAP